MTETNTLMYDLNDVQVTINKPLHILDKDGRTLMIVKDNSLIFPNSKKVTPSQIRLYDQSGKNIGCHITFEIHFKDTDE